MNKRELKRFAGVLSSKAVEYRDEPFELRAGGMSHWYVDHRRGLNAGGMMQRACSLIVAKARDEKILYQTVAGGGVGGNGLAVVTAWLTDGRTEWVIANMDKSDINDIENGYGLHGGDVEGRDVLLVDDIGTTGSSLLELADMVRTHGGNVEHAINVSDRSRGKTASALGEIGIAYHALLEFREDQGKLVPMTTMAQVA